MEMSKILFFIDHSALKDMFEGKKKGDQLIKKITKLSKETMAFFKRANEYLDLFYHHFYKYDADTLEKLLRERADIIKDIPKLFLKAPPEESMIIHNLINVVELSFNLSGYKVSMVV